MKAMKIMKITNNKILASIAFVCLGMMMNACKHEPDISTLPDLTYEKDIKIIINSNCGMNGCHGSDNGSEFPLLTYEQLMDEADVKPGEPNDSKLYEVITDNGFERMPPDQPLNDLDIKRIYIWILKGAKKE